jgi:hypothetical protein
MVKNTKGGSSHKKQASKAQPKNTNQNSNVRMATEPEHAYAVVTKSFSMTEHNFKTIDGEVLYCKVGGGFRKEYKLITIGTLLLVGIFTDFAPTKAGMRKCQLLEIYTQREVDILKSRVNLNWNNLIIDTFTGKSTGDDGFDISNEAYDKMMMIKEVSNNTINDDVKINNTNNEEQNWSFDDI